MNKILLSALAAGALALTVPAAAQRATEKAVEKAADKAAASTSVAIPKNTFYKGLGPTQYLAKTRLIGQNVVDKNGAKIGDIEDIVLGTKDNQIDGVIMGVGGFLGVGEKKIGVRIGALKFDTKDGKTVVSMPSATKELLAAVQAYDGQRTLLQKAGDVAKKAGESASDAAKKAADAVKDAAKKATDAVKSEPAKK